MTSGRNSAPTGENLVGRRISHRHGHDQECTRNNSRATDWYIEVSATDSDGKTNHEANDESHTATPFRKVQNHRRRAIDLIRVASGVHSGTSLGSFSHA